MDAMDIAETGSAQDRTPRYAMATNDHHPDQPRTEPELRAQRLGFALNSLAAELVTERRKVAQLQKQLEQLKARLASHDMSHSSSRIHANGAMLGGCPPPSLVPLSPAG